MKIKHPDVLPSGSRCRSVVKRQSPRVSSCLRTIPMHEKNAKPSHTNTSTSMLWSPKPCLCTLLQTSTKQHSTSSPPDGKQATHPDLHSTGDQIAHTKAASQKGTRQKVAMQIEHHVRCPDELCTNHVMTNQRPLHPSSAPTPID